MTKPRRAFGWKDVLLVLIYQGQEQGNPVLCYRCKKPITAEDVRGGNVEREHVHERELDGPDEPENCRFSHKRPCHDRITNGTKATSAGSSKNRIAKATHPNRTEKFVVNKRPLGITAAVDPGKRKPCCGEYPESCKCPPRPERSSFGRRTAVR